jgi:hypothetical protein
MKFFSFPAAAIEKAIAKRQLTLASPHKEWFAQRWAQKPYRKAFLDNKAVPLVTLLVKCKTWDDETFNSELAAWDVRFHEAEAEVLRPLVQGDGLLQLMQKAVPAVRAQALLDKLNQHADQ